MKSFKELREKTLTAAEKKKREEIAKAIEKDEPDMPMDKKMAIATAQAKKVAEGAEKYTVKKGNMTRKVDGATADKMKRQGWKLIATEGLDEGAMSDFHLMVQEKVPAAQIAKELGLDLKTVKKLMKDMKESVDEALSPSYKNKYIGKDKASLQKTRKSFLSQIDDLIKFKKKTTKDSEVVKLQDLLKKVDNALKGVKESKKPVSQMTPAEKKADAERRKKYKAYQKSKRESIEEARKDSSADLYFNTYSAAVQHAKSQAEKKGFEVVEDDWFNQVTTGKGKPGRGKTTRHTLKLTKNGKPVRQGLSIQVYNRETDKNPYELNFYVS